MLIFTDNRISGSSMKGSVSAERLKELLEEFRRTSEEIRAADAASGIKSNFKVRLVKRSPSTDPDKKNSE